MKNFITLSVAFAALSSTAFAASTPTNSRSSNPTHQDVLLSGEFGLGTLIDKFHFGAGFRAELPVNLEGNHFRFGGQTGFYFGPSDPTTWVIPILATGTYDFRVSSGTIVPYLGLGLGLAIRHISFLGISDTATRFMWQFKPGASFGSNHMYAELPLGTIDGTFYIVPSIGMHF